MKQSAGLLIALILLPGGPALAHQTDPGLDSLFVELLSCEDALGAQRLEKRIWEIWLLSGDDAVDRRMRDGVRAMNARHVDAALAAFDAIVRERPDFAEGWNKRATLFYLAGDYEASLEDIERTLALEPRHFGALSGLALIREAQGRPFEALEALEQVTRIHPCLPHLKLRIDHLTEQLGEPI